MFDSNEEKELVERKNGGILLKVDTGREVINFDHEEAQIDLDESTVRVEKISPTFAPKKVHLPVNTMSAADNDKGKSEHYSFRIFDVRSYSKVVNTNEKKVKDGEITLPYTEIVFEY